MKVLKPRPFSAAAVLLCALGLVAAAVCQLAYQSGSLSCGIAGDTPAAPRSSVVPDLVVALDGSGQYETIHDALSAAPAGSSTRRTVIYIKGGVYTEYPVVKHNQPFLTLIGDPSGKTIITGSHYAGQNTPDGSYGTENSQTFWVNATDFIAEGITFANTKHSDHHTSDEQAVALKVSGDRAAFYDCTILGSQDTLYVEQNRQYYKNCYIAGHTDFIFGEALAFFDNCTMAVTAPGGGITAQHRTSATERSGFSFVGGRIISDTTDGIVHKSWLGRVWGIYAVVVFANVVIQKDVIKKPGWGFVSGVSTTNVKAFMGEYKCTGDDYDVSERVSWSHQLTAAQAAPFLTVDYVDGKSWLVSPPGGAATGLRSPPVSAAPRQQPPPKVPTPLSRPPPGKPSKPPPAHSPPPPSPRLLVHPPPPPKSRSPPPPKAKSSPHLPPPPSPANTGHHLKYPSSRPKGHHIRYPLPPASSKTKTPSKAAGTGHHLKYPPSRKTGHHIKYPPPPAPKKL
eukprot:SM000001S04465  [mRNA]  locus=s1:309136:311866:- [translate_table: standard]